MTIDAGKSEPPVGSHVTPLTTEPIPVARLVIPASPRYLRLARLTASSMAGDLGFGLSAVEDVRIGVDELCAVLIEGAPESAELELVYRETGEALVVEGRCEAGAALPALNRVAQELLTIMADEHSVNSVDGFHTFHFVKRLPS